jgi:hypothetical protein
VIITCVDMFGKTVVHVAAKRCELAALRYLHFELAMDFSQLDFDAQSPLQCVPRKCSEGDAGGYMTDLAQRCRLFIEFVVSGSQGGDDLALFLPDPPPPLPSSASSASASASSASASSGGPVDLSQATQSFSFSLVQPLREGEADHEDSGDEDEDEDGDGEDGGDKVFQGFDEIAQKWLS